MVVPVGPADPHRDVEEVDAGIQVALDPRSEELRVRVPLVLEREVERHRAQHVEDRRPLHEVDRARRVLRLRPREELEAAAVDEGERHRGGDEVAACGHG